MTTFVNAQDYERLMGRWSTLLGRELVGFAAPTAGARALDVGCGTGALTDALLTAGAGVDGIDPSPAFVEFARHRVGAARARLQVGDATSLPYADATFDWTGSMLVLNFIPERERALAEMRRVTRRGGQVVGCLWDYGGAMPMLRGLWDAAAALDAEAAASHESRMPWCREGELGDAWRAAGLDAVREGDITLHIRFESFDDYWTPFLAGIGPSGAYVASRSAAQREALAQRLRDDLWNGEPERPRTFPARAWVVVGMAP